LDKLKNKDKGSRATGYLDEDRVIMRGTNVTKKSVGVSNSRLRK